MRLQIIIVPQFKVLGVLAPQHLRMPSKSSKKGIDKRKEYNVMFMDEEIRLWEEFAKKYAEGTQIRLKADKEIGRLKYENSKQWIDKEKYYKRLSLQDELAAWERVQKRYKEGHEYRMQAERELFRLKQEIQQADIKIQEH